MANLQSKIIIFENKKTDLMYACSVGKQDKNKHNRPVALFTPYCTSAHIHTILRGNSITAIHFI